MDFVNQVLVASLLVKTMLKSYAMWASSMLSESV